MQECQVKIYDNLSVIISNHVALSTIINRLQCICKYHRQLNGLISDNTAGLVTRQGGFRRMQQNVYLVPVVVEDGGYPIRSSTGTVLVRVCACDTDGSMLSCSAEAVFYPMGLSTGAVMAILLCIVILLGERNAACHKYCVLIARHMVQFMWTLTKMMRQVGNKTQHVVLVM